MYARDCLPTHAHTALPINFPHSESRPAPTLCTKSGHHPLALLLHNWIIPPALTPAVISPFFNKQSSDKTLPRISPRCPPTVTLRSIPMDSTRLPSAELMIQGGLSKLTSVGTGRTHLDVRGRSCGGQVADSMGIQQLGENRLSCSN